MHILKKKLGVLFVILIFSSCGSLPKKPQIELCVHDQPSGMVECHNNQTDEYRTLNIDDTDLYIMTSPDDWGLILLYIRKLERKVKKKEVKRELSKIIDMDLTLKNRLP